MSPRERLLAEFERRAARYEPELRRGILEAFRRLASRMDDAAVERAIKTGDLDAAVKAALPEGAMNRAFYGVRKVAREAMTATANATIRNTPALREIGIRFDTLSPTVIEAARTIETGSYGYLKKEMADGLRSAIEAGLEAGKGPRAVARGLTETLGLTRYQEGIIGNFRQALETGDLGKALGYELRDKRLDAIIKKAAESGKPLTPAQIDRMATAYRQRYKAFNAETHARTTALTAQRVGAQEAWRQSAADLGPDYIVVKVWRATMDTRTRDSHRRANNTKALLDGKYPNGDSYPGEAEPWNCRCVETYKVQKAGTPIVQPES